MKKTLQLIIALLVTLKCVNAQQVISSNTTWSGTVILTQNVIINPSAKLTILAGTQIKVAFIDGNNDLKGDIKIIVNGELVCKGLSSCSPVKFTPLNQGNNGFSWQGIEINSNTTNDSLIGLVIRGAETGLNILSTCSMFDSEIDSCGSYGIKCNLGAGSSSVKIWNTNVSSSGTGIHNIGLGKLNLKWDIIKNNRNGIFNDYYCITNISTCDIQSNSRFGVFNSGNVIIYNSIISNNGGFGFILNESSYNNIANCDVIGNYLSGILLAGAGNTTIQYSNIKNNQGTQFELSDYGYYYFESGLLDPKPSSPPTITANYNCITTNLPLTNILSDASLISKPYGGNCCGCTPSRTCSSIVPVGRLTTCTFDCFCTSPYQPNFSGNVNGAVYFNWYVADNFVTVHSNSSWGPNWNFPSYTVNANFSGNYDRVKNYNINTIPQTSFYAMSSQGPCQQCNYSAGNNVYTKTTYGWTGIQNATVQLGGYLMFNNYRGSASYNFQSNYFGSLTPSNLFYDLSSVSFDYGGFLVNSPSNVGANFQNLNSQITLQSNSMNDTICGSLGSALVSTKLSNISGATYNWYLNSNLFASTSVNSFLVPVAGQWACSVSLNGCTINTNALNLIQGPIINLSLVKGDTLLCAGKQTILKVNGANNYNWSNGISSDSNIIQPISSGYFSVVGSFGGCSSTLNIFVKVNPLPQITVTPYPSVILCQGNSATLTAVGGLSYVWNNNLNGSTLSVNTPGVYNVIGFDVNGCADTSANVTVVQLPTSGFLICNNSLICKGSSTILSASGGTSYLWSNGASTSSISVSPNQTTIYTVDITNSNSCVKHLSQTITVKPTSTNSITASICQGSIYTIGSNTYNTSGTYITHLTNYRGCDSAVTLNLTVKPNSTKVITTSICQGSSYLVGTTNYATSGTYIDHFTNYLGCDSMVTLNLTVKPISANSIIASICQGSSYTIGSNTYNTSGTYITHLTNYLGCDSMVTLNLTVKPNSTNVITTSICQGANYTIGSTSYTASGTYLNHLTNYLGCDSAVTLNLTVKPISANSIAASVCQGSSYTVGSNTYNTSGTYITHLTNYLGCDSVITLILTVHPSSINVIYDTICVGQKVIIGGHQYFSTGNYIDSLINRWGCDSIVNLKLYVHSKPASVSIVGYTSITPLQSYQYVVSLSPGISYYWYAQNGAILGGQGTNSVNVSWGTNAPYRLSLIQFNAVGCSDTSYLEVYDNVGVRNLTSRKSIFVIYPNPNTGRFILENNCRTCKQMQVEIMSLDGKLLYSQNADNSTGKINIDLPLAAGMYWVKMSNGKEGFSEVRKFVINNE